MKSNIKTAFLTLATILVCVQPVQAQPISTEAKQAIVVDYDTGTVLLEKNADEKMPTSSMSKVISMYLVFEALKNGSLKLDEELPVSEKAWQKGGSKMFVEVNKTVKVEDLIRGVIVQSGNDATIVLAEGIAGTEDSFADALNQKAAELGMKNSNFTNASGWPDPDHFSTAKDLSILATALIKNFPEYYSYYSEKDFTYNNIKQGNRNPLLYRNIGADGIKTGHTEAGGYGLIGSGVSDGRRVVIVINGLEDARARAEESAKLLDWGLKRFENKTLFTANEEIAQADVVMGKQATVALVTDEDVKLTLPKFVTENIKVNVKYDGPVIAPIKKGDKIGTLEIEIPNMPAQTRQLYAANDVQELGFFAKTFVKAKHFIAGN